MAVRERSLRGNLEWLQSFLRVQIPGVANHFQDQSSSYMQLLLASLTALLKGEADFRPNAGPAWAELSKAWKIRPRGLVCSILRGIHWRADSRQDHMQSRP